MHCKNTNYAREKEMKKGKKSFSLKKYVHTRANVGNPETDRLKTEHANTLSFCYFCTHRRVSKMRSENAEFTNAAGGVRQRRTRKWASPHAAFDFSPAEIGQRSTRKSVQKAMEWAVFAK